MTPLTKENAVRLLLDVTNDINEQGAEKVAELWFDANSYEDLENIYPEVLDLERQLHQPRLILRRSLIHLKKLCINQIMRLHGNEYLGICRATGVMYDYLNAGDLYAPTVVFRTTPACCPHIYIGSVADIKTLEVLNDLEEFTP